MSASICYARHLVTGFFYVRKYGKPVVLVACDNVVGRGSARSIGDLNVYNILKKVSSCFESFGGHKSAAGFSILPENIAEFEKKLLIDSLRKSKGNIKNSAKQIGITVRKFSYKADKYNIKYKEYR